MEKHAWMTSNDIHLPSNSNHIIVTGAEITAVLRAAQEASSERGAAGKPRHEQPGCNKCAGGFCLLNKCQKQMFGKLVLMSHFCRMKSCVIKSPPPPKQR